LTAVPPKVLISHRDAPDSSINLSCHARSSYPRPIHISWMRDGKDILAEKDSSGILPNADSTYYTQSSLEISLQEEDRHRYACQVEHSSLSEPERIWSKGGVNRRSWRRGSHSPLTISGIELGPVAEGSISLPIISVNSSSLDIVGGGRITMREGLLCSPALILILCLCFRPMETQLRSGNW
uniref:Ig-like domain-containing protein n=1 Tax=Gopherus evgoodei TaxID=1825980 RepID=A0A8C5EW59_9SAUR